MPPRYSYWTIIAGGLPTAFRAYERDELMPTFTRLREKHPDAEMKWFARGKLWASPDAAREDTERRRGGFARDGARPPREREGQSRDGAGRPPRGEGTRQGDATRRSDTGDRARHRDAPGEPPRNREWRPGGEHRDPRQKYKDAKKAKNLDWRREKFARKQGGDDRFRPPGAPPDSRKREWDRPRGSEPAPPPASSRRFENDQRAGGKREWSQPRDGGKRDWARPREGGHAPPPASGKRFDNRGGGTRDDYRAREDRDRQDRHPRRDETRALPERDRPAPPRQDWRRKPASTGRDWNAPREGGPRPEPGTRNRERDERRPPPEPRTRNPEGRDEYRPRDEYRTRDDRNRPPRRDEVRPLPERNRTAPPRPDWRQRPASPSGAPKPFNRENRGGGQREWNKPREGGKREWDRPREGGARDRDRPREGGKREWNKPPDAGPVTPKRDPSGAREGGRPFQRQGFERNQGTEVPPQPPRPPGPNREPRPSESPKPGAPPRPAEPEVLPPGPPERGRHPERFGPKGRLNKAKRRP